MMVVSCLMLKTTDHPSKQRHKANVGTMLGQRRRRWSNIVLTLASCLVFAGISQRDQSLPLHLAVVSSIVVSYAGSTALALCLLDFRCHLALYTSPTSPGERERHYKVDTRTILNEKIQLLKQYRPICVYLNNYNILVHG